MHLSHVLSDHVFVCMYICVCFCLPYHFCVSRIIFWINSYLAFVFKCFFIRRNCVLITYKYICIYLIYFSEMDSFIKKKKKKNTQVCFQV